MKGAFVALTIGGVLIYSGLKGLSIIDVLSGKTGNPLDPAGGRHRDPTTGGTTTTTSGDLPHGTGGSTPRAIIEQIVIPLARKNGINVTSESVAEANARHSKMTLTGGVSDHSGPGNVRWAADMSNGQRPTPQMDALAQDLADQFDIPWNGSGAKSATHGHFRYQMIYRSLIGGNHFNHVHFGIKVV